MSRLGVVFVASCLVAGSGATRAGIIIPPRDPHDDPKVVARLMDDPRMVESRKTLDSARKAIRNWKYRDFREAFGPPSRPESVVDALMAPEARLLMLSGLHSANPADNKDHVEAFAVGDLGSLIAYFGHDGESTSHVLFYLKVDPDFPRLDRVEALGKRLDWERPRFERLSAEVERRRRAAVGWEVDAGAEKARSSGVESGDFAVKLKALIRWGQERGYTLDHEPARGDETPRWTWHRGEGEGEGVEAYHARGMKGADGTPSDFKFYRPDGTLARDETGWPSLDMIRWYREDGEKMARVESGKLLDNGAWRVDDWTWYDRNGEAVRVEEDTNGDGLPDVEGESNLGYNPPRRPIKVEQSWAVHPELIPESVQFRELRDRKVPVRKLAGPGRR